jgi:hypothetical protein
LLLIKSVVTEAKEKMKINEDENDSIRRKEEKIINRRAMITEQIRFCLLCEKERGKMMKDCRGKFSESVFKFFSMS